MMLDEVDKLGRDFRGGSIFGADEVLDPDRTLGPAIITAVQFDLRRCCSLPPQLMIPPGAAAGQHGNHRVAGYTGEEKLHNRGTST